MFWGSSDGASVELSGAGASQTFSFSIICPGLWQPTRYGRGVTMATTHHQVRYIHLCKAAEAGSMDTQRTHARAKKSPRTSGGQEFQSRLEVQYYIFEIGNTPVVLAKYIATK